jgi:hypothetical protein
LDGPRGAAWEDGFVSALEKRGVTATPSYNLFSQAPPDTDEIEGAVRDHDFDGVLLVHRLGATIQPTEVPGVPRQFGKGGVRLRSVSNDRVDVLSTAGDWVLVWSGTTSIHPNASRDVNAEIAKRIVPELLSQRVIAR